MSMKNWMKKRIKKEENGSTRKAFMSDAIRREDFRDFKSWEELKFYLRFWKAERSFLRAAHAVYDEWVLTDPAAKFDGLTRKDIAALRRVTRQVWSWSTPKKICIERATDGNGWCRCEKCKQRVPKIHVDHIEAVGDLDSGYFARLFCSSKGLQALCKKCHDAKTKWERQLAKLDVSEF